MMNTYRPPHPSSHPVKRKEFSGDKLQLLNEVVLELTRDMSLIQAVHDGLREAYSIPLGEPRRTMLTARQEVVDRLTAVARQDNALWQNALSQAQRHLSAW